MIRSSRSSVAALLLGCLLLAGCASKAPVKYSPGAAPAVGSLRPPPPSTGDLQCVPVARAISGVEIYGDAHTWWGQAAQKYERGSKPEVGAVLSLKRTGKLRLGHVAVVVQLQENPRRLLVTHANWGGDSSTRGVIHERQPVEDLSPGNDWTLVRFLNVRGTFGQPYPADGFIYQRRIGS